MRTDRAKGIHHVSYNDNPKTHPLIKFENQVLEYRAVYQEKVRTEDGSHIEPHDCLLRFFVEDNTMEVIEKPVSNSGRTEFRLIKRTRVPKPGDTGIFYSPEDLFAGNRVLAYGMTFHILHGTTLAENYTSKRFGSTRLETDRPGTSNAESRVGSTGGRPGTSSADLMTTRKERVSSFLTQQDFAQQVDTVCLDLVWDDTEALYGEVHELKMKYYLLDDTVDVFCVESKKFESKYSGSQCIIKRQKLQKEVELAAPLQGLDARMRLSSSAGQRHMAPKEQYVDCSAPGMFYHWSELLPGTDINMLGRKAVVVGFGNKRTERFYEKMMGSELVAELKSKFRFDTTREVPVYQHPVPEHIGIGSYEDSLRSVKDIAPKAPPSTAQKAGALRFKLQFKAKLLSAAPSDQSRVFIITYFCEDSSMMIYESSPRNSGRPSYTFAQRDKYVKSYDMTNGNEPQYYEPRDVGVGAVIIVNGHHFELTDAAPGSITFMEAHPEYFA